MADATSCTNTASIRADNMQTLLLNAFKLTCVEKIDPPEGGQGQDWYRYVIESGCSTITGQRRGSIEDVTAYATHCAEQLNARGLKVQSIWVPRSKKLG
jgi:hypothetical protein